MSGGIRKNKRKFNWQQSVRQRLLSIIFSITGRPCRRPVNHRRQPLECQLDVTAGDHRMMWATGDRWGGGGGGEPRLSSP